MLFSTTSGALQVLPLFGALSRTKLPGSVELDSATITSAPGTYVWSRASSTDARVYVNGTQSGTTVKTACTATFASETLRMFFDATNIYAANYSDVLLGASGAGLGLSSSDAANLTTIVNALEAALSR